MTPTPHTCHPLWVAGRPIATCDAHYGQPLDRASVPTGGTR